MHFLRSGRSAENRCETAAAADRLIDAVLIETCWGMAAGASAKPHRQVACPVIEAEIKQTSGHIQMPN